MTPIPLMSNALGADALDQDLPAQARLRGTTWFCAQALYQHMSDLSEECWCAAWDGGTESALWAMVLTGRGEPWGLSAVTDDDVALLTMLARACNGWWTWTESGPAFASLEDWSAASGSRP